MCTTKAKFLDEPIPEVTGWKVLIKTATGFESPVFAYDTPQWKTGEKIKVNSWRQNLYNPMAGFHIFKYQLSAILYAHDTPGGVVKKVKGYNVTAKGKGILLPIYIAQEAELLPD